MTGWLSCINGIPIYSTRHPRIETPQVGPSGLGLSLGLGPGEHLELETDGTLSTLAVHT
jgi:hypothetical protein